MSYISTKTYGHEVGLSCAFRQWRATHSHCRFLHGYAVSVRLEFETQELDARNWVVDFGGLKDLKRKLEDTFDHKTVVAHDDPQMDWFHRGHELGLLDLVILDDVGCERFAEHVYQLAANWLKGNGYAPRCRVSLVEVREHGANSAIYKPCAS
jgi:6-pyruvoyltetrahydropterin/6-carboxytetrahydropterin synthase